MIEWMEGLQHRGRKITDFKFIGHGSSTELEIGLHNLSWYYAERIFTVGTPGIGAVSVSQTILGAFAPNARIELCACRSYSYKMPYAPAWGFKYLLPNARVYGYPGAVVSNFVFGGSSGFGWPFARAEVDSRSLYW